MNIYAIRLAPLCAFCLPALTSAMVVGVVPSNLTDATVTFHVQVVSSPCNFQDNTEIVVEMGETSTRTLQTQRYGDWHTFTLGFTECNIDTFQNIAIQFLGTEDTHLPGRLALDSGSGAKGAAIGIYYGNNLLAINNNSAWIPLQVGDNTLPFSARIERTADDTLQSGDYTATAHFKLIYL
ncbi:fimbrial protein [Candidatus Symbiopectobacterium sp. NZEC135]|uniref:fimbrial protein n=1 Tax=Candidatus Symbiopectobacterium sp. NZEC135 TaxID=2820471 RepID=UPI0022271930|nr:fimbrial protein [Candidatus Symbiopectobacterium sp. NZEC135]MCW2480064.1 type 1 fimbrial protein [Candidatus Symbiopectobacterium sp. NZEC135]